MLNQLLTFVKTRDFISSELTEVQIEEIYAAGVNHGIFSNSNYGIRDKRNSVCCLIGTLRDLVPKMPTHEEFLDCNGTFNGTLDGQWGALNGQWFIETKWGVFEWSNPDYYGTGEISYVCKTWEECVKTHVLGQQSFIVMIRNIRNYIGSNFKLQF